MTDENGGYPLPMGFDEVVAFLESVNANAICPVCGGNHGWGVVARLEATGVRDHYPGLVGAHEDGSADLSHAFPVVTVTCKNCGYMRLHDVQTLRQRQTDRRAKS
ncbi:hypothetical protein [Hydrogenophaga sp. T2]|uniref:hypothetical protein n=1 Tax=Hydrogenophaga sp. T2 TaxID=3132823 RepID=UPI003CF78B51